MTMLLWALQGWVAKVRRRVALIHRRRSAARRALDWAGIGPARHNSAGLPTADHPYGEGDPLAPIIGIAVHAGPHLWILIWRRP